MMMGAPSATELAAGRSLANPDRVRWPSSHGFGRGAALSAPSAEPGLGAVSDSVPDSRDGAHS